MQVSIHWTFWLEKRDQEKAQTPMENSDLRLRMRAKESLNALTRGNRIRRDDQR
jgi:hypothetical protein